MTTTSLSSRQVWNSHIEVGSAFDPAQLTYQYSPELPKPCMHPLITPRGHVISGFQMADHKWHRGLWFTIKFINRTNFWEEIDPFGIQTSLHEPAIDILNHDQTRITHQQIWKSSATGAVISELRQIRMQFLHAGITLIDWKTTLRALQDISLDRTPFTTWGGYGGLSFRAARELHNVSFLLPNGETCNALTGQNHAWVVMQGQMDGSPDEHISLGMIDHPSNPRSPSPWYCKALPGFSYLNAAFLFHEAMPLAKDQTLEMNYRIAFRDGNWNAQEFDLLAESFRQSEVTK